MKNLFLLMLGSTLVLLSCSTEDSSSNNLESNVTIETNSKSSYSRASESNFLRFDVYRRSRMCRSGFGICTMKNKRDALEEEAQRRKELEELEQQDLGIYQSYSIVAPIDPTEDFEGGVLDVIYDLNALLEAGKLQLDIHLAEAPTSAPMPLIVEETLSLDIDGQIFTLQADNYEYISSMGVYGGYTITISSN